MHWRPHLQFRKMEDAAKERSSRIWPPKSYKEEVSLLERSKPKSTEYKISGLLMFPEIGKQHAKKNLL